MPIIVVNSKRKCPNKHVRPNNTFAHAWNSNTVSANGIFSVQSEGYKTIQNKMIGI